MNGDLEIPERAWDIGGGYRYWGQRVEAMAPIIVATELRRWADDIDPGTDEPGMVDTAKSAWDVRRFWASGLRLRADKLDPGGTT